MTKILKREDLDQIRQAERARQEKTAFHVTVCGGGGCVSSGCGKTRDAVSEFIAKNNLSDKVELRFTGCLGLCSQGPLMTVEPEGVLYVKVTPEMAQDILSRHILSGEPALEYTFFDEKTKTRIPLMKDIPFFSARYG